MTTDTKPKTMAEHIESLKKLGLVRKRQAHEVRSLFYAVSKSEFEIAKEGYFALMHIYQVTTEDMLLIREALAYMYYHKHVEMVGKHDLRNEELAAKVKWQ